MFSITVQSGEWFEVGAKLTDPTVTARLTPKDLTGKAVTLVVRDGPTSSGALVTWPDQMATLVDSGAGGEVAAGARPNAVGKFYGTITVGDAADGRGWPVKETFAIVVTDAP